MTVTVAMPDALTTPVVDTHCHLDVHDRRLQGDAAPNALRLVQAAAEVGVTRIVQIGCDLESARWTVENAPNLPGVVAGVAIHPNDAARMVERDGQQALDAAWAEIAVLAQAPIVRAVGETGLDYFRTTDDAGKSVQQASFRWHINLAKALGKALVIHDRDSHDDVISILLEEGAPEQVIFHCFSGDAAMAQICADHGWYCSFAGPVTYKANAHLREAAELLPQELVLVETDAPYLAPEPNRGKANASTLMPFTVRVLAEVRGEDVDVLCQALTDNALRALGHWE
jgi:TatD DNase family protein